MKALAHRATLLALATGLATNLAVALDSTSLTIYSTTYPGGIPADMYRPVPPHMAQYGYYYNYGQQRIPGYAVVRQNRDLDIAPGRSTLTYTDVAALLDPTTVRFESLTDADGVRVLEQDYRFDLIDLSKLLSRHIGKELKVDGIKVTLLSANPGGMLVENDEGEIYFVNNFSGVRLTRELAEGFLTTPTLRWEVAADRGGEHETRLTYQTQGITWWADYNITFTPGDDANSGTLDLAAWVSVLNRSGATYENAQLKLIAGDVERLPDPSDQYYGAYPARARMEMAADGMGPGFQEKAFFEYHLYTLGRPTTIPDNSTKQVELFEPASGIPAKKVLVYYGQQGSYSFLPEPATDRNYGLVSNPKVDVYLTFNNSEENHLGMPLPSGRIRVSQADDDGSLEFIGENAIDHTPKDEDVLLKLGQAFDVVGERRQADFRIDYDEHWMEEDIEIKVRNHKAEAVEVIIKENQYRWTNWEIKSAQVQVRGVNDARGPGGDARDARWEKIDARTIHVPVKIRADGEAVLRYTVRYTW